MHTQSFFSLFYLHECFACLYVCTVCVYTVWIEAKITRGISWN